MKRSMKTRLVAIFVVTIVIIIGVISLANVVLLPYFYQSNKVSQMQGVYSRVINICENVDWNKMDSEQKDTIYDKLDQLSSNTNMSIYLVQIRVYQGSGDIAELAYVYPSDSERLQQVTKNQLDKYVKSIYFGQKLDDNCKMITQTANYSMYNVYDTRVDSNFLELTGKMPDNYWIYLRSNYQSIQESASVSNQFMLYVGMIVMIAGVFIMYFVSNQYTKPILRLAAHAKNMQKLDFSTRYKDNRDDEIGVLGNSMNALSDRLEKTISELKTANNELQLDLQRRSEQEQMRQEFLANVSHELKTPIALIQGYAEGLQENINDDAESREFYCEVIIDEADKMNRMVKKLLTLNQLEFGNDQVIMERFDMTELIRGVANSTRILMEQKGIRLELENSEEAWVWGDEFKVEEVITNYMSNAINHADGEKLIRVFYTRSEDKLRVSVFNTGQPIPEEDIEKIWVKFYKVDKARTREYGGSGIGLSIVKAIMDSFHQRCGVINHEDGVEFWMELGTK